MLVELAAWGIELLFAAAPPNGATPVGGVHTAGPVKVILFKVLGITVFASFRLVLAANGRRVRKTKDFDA